MRRTLPSKSAASTVMLPSTTRGVSGGRVGMAACGEGDWESAGVASARMAPSARIRFESILLLRKEKGARGIPGAVVQGSEEPVISQEGGQRPPDRIPAAGGRSRGAGLERHSG